MKKVAFIAPVCMVLALSGCDKPPAEIVEKIKEGVEQACLFKVSQQWIADIVVKADITIQLVDATVTKICDGVLASRARQVQSLMKMPPCANGEVEINGESYCIEGEDVPAEEGK